MDYINIYTPYILKDLSNNLWKFYLDGKKDFFCNNFFEDIKLDGNVVEFDVNINYLGVIQVVYLTKDGVVKYCELNKEWESEVLYTLSDNQDKIQEITFKTINDDIHIFFLYKSCGEKRFSLLHYKWSNGKFQSYSVALLSPISIKYKNYFIDKSEDSLNVFYISKEKDELVISMCQNKEGKWQEPKKLYRLNGEEIKIFTLGENNYFHILNLSKEDNIYILEDVVMDEKGNMKNFKVHESNKVIKNPLLLSQNNNIYAMWSEENSLMYSNYNSGWQKVKNIALEAYDKVENFRYVYEKNPWDKFKGKSIFLLEGEDIRLILPEEIVIYNKTEESREIEEDCDADSTIKRLLREISYSKMINDSLEKRLNLLKKQLQERNIILLNSKEQLEKSIEEKKKIETENKQLGMFRDKCIEEISSLRRKLVEEENKNIRKKEEKLKEIERLTLSLNAEKEKHKNICSYVNDLELKLHEKEAENNILKENLEGLKKRGIFDKFFK